MSTRTIDYRLPVTTARFTVSTIESRFVDEFERTDGDGLDRVESTLPTTTADVDFVTAGDARRAMVLKVRNCWLFDVSATLKLTDDLRLSSASSESTGALGQALVAGVRLAATAAGLSTSEYRVATVTPAERFEEREPAAAAAITTYRAQISLADAQIVALSAASQAAAIDDQGAQFAILSRIRSFDVMRASFERELERALRRKESWISARTTVHQSTAVMALPTDDLPALSDLDLDADAGTYSVDEGKLGDAGALWESAKTLVTIDRTTGAALPSHDVQPAIDNPKRANGVWFRVPRSVDWTVWRSAGSDTNPLQLVKVRSGSTLVVDESCKLRFTIFRRSLWAKRSVSLDFSDSGALTGFASTSQSTIAALATAATDATTAVTDGLDSAQSIRTSLATLADGPAERHLADLTRQVDTRKQELELAGQDATSADYAELERLKQAQDIAEAQAAIDPSALATAALTRGTALGVAQQDATQVIRDLRAELTLEKLRTDIAALPKV